MGAFSWSYLTTDILVVIHDDFFSDSYTHVNVIVKLLFKSVFYLCENMDYKRVIYHMKRCAG